MAKIKLCIQVGHDTASLEVGNPLKGQTGTNGELELQKKVFYEIKKIIDSQYSESIALYYDDARCLNAPEMDYFLAPHFDGSTNSTYNGGFVDCNPDSLTKDKDWEFARILSDNYFNDMGIRFAPEHRTANSTYYYGFNYTGENTIQTIIELGTLTNPDDRAKCQDASKIARLLVKGIVSYLEKYDTRFKPATPQPPTVSCETQLDELRKQLEKQKNLYTKLQDSSKKELAVKQDECEKLKSRLDKIKKFVSMT